MSEKSRGAVRQKEWRDANPEKARAIKQRYIENNREKVNAANRLKVARNKAKGKVRKMSAVRKRGYHLKQMYGLTLEEYDDMRKAQNYSCAICKTHEDLCPKKKLCVDHCHTTGKVRKLLCFNCNSLLGHARERVEVLLAAVEYLRG